MKSILLTVFFISLINKSFAGFGSGGTIVGNGAGVAENFFQNAYQSLPLTISNCISSDKCVTDLKSKLILGRILGLAKLNLDNKSRLIFTTASETNPLFFKTEINEPERIAKTFPDPNSPIYINLDMLYDVKGKMTLDFSAMTRILVHELGHKVGIENHAELDILGATVSNFSELNSSVFKYTPKKAKDEKISFSILNLVSPYPHPILIFNWKDNELINLTYTLKPFSKCLYDTENFQAMELTNGHYELGKNGKIQFKAWMEIACYEKFSESLNYYTKELIIPLDADFKILDLVVNDKI